MNRLGLQTVIGVAIRMVDCMVEGLQLRSLGISKSQLLRSCSEDRPFGGGHSNSRYPSCIESTRSNCRIVEVGTSSQPSTFRPVPVRTEANEWAMWSRIQRYVLGLVRIWQFLNGPLYCLFISKENRQRHIYYHCNRQKYNNEHDEWWIASLNELERRVFKIWTILT